MNYIEVLACFVAFYPLYMSFVWTLGGLLFFFRWERRPRPTLPHRPLFSIIIAARNEEAHIGRVIANLERLTYPEFEVIAVNDGSTDRTGRVLNRAARKYPWLKVVHLTPNSGKSRAVNTGASFSRGDLLLVMDADSFIAPDALDYLAWHFIRYPRTGAVTGNPRIMNRTTLLGKLQVGEYSSIIGLIKRSQRILGKVLTVSGVMAAYRKSAFYECGCFDSDTLTEDIDITWKLQRRHWDVRYEPRALCYILSPETLKGLWRQRVRWAQGGVSVMRKHADIWLDWKQRRFWPVYVEYIAGILWSFGLGVLLLHWLAGCAALLFTGPSSPAQSLLPATWIGPVLALASIIQFAVSFYIDQHYEGGRLFRYYAWIVWYPFFYWLISATATYVGVYNVFIRKVEVTAIWRSPDRGVHTTTG